ncbi:MAG: DNA methylase [Oscillospiraceae bacterium]|nr:DNA methylase [Oscillospiraceae bacterium]
MFCPKIRTFLLLYWNHQTREAEKLKKRIYACIDLKSFYASVECVERGLDPLTTNLLVADGERTQKTICLAVSPSLKAYGIPGRARLFEAAEKIKLVNAQRRQKNKEHTFTNSSCFAPELAEHPDWEVTFITAPPRMALYVDYSTRIYQIYLRFLAPQDIHVYSIDEVFLDLTPYLSAAGKDPFSFVKTILRQVLEETGITATAGIGTNLYLCKVAMDIVAKKVPADADGVRIAFLDELSYRQTLWDHRPLTDFWRIGRGYARKLEGVGLMTMGDIARCSIGKPTEFYNEELLYRLFGINAELLIDHAWGWENCTIAQIHAYRPENRSIASGQVLQSPYSFEKARIIVREMIDLLVLDLVDKDFLTDQIVLTVGYDVENLTDPVRRAAYQGPVTVDHYGRKVPKHAHGTANLGGHTSSTRQISAAVVQLYDRIVDPALLIRRLNLSANHIRPEDEISADPVFEQLDLFTDYAALQKQRQQESLRLEKEKQMQKAVITIKKRFGKNAILKGTNLQEGATTQERNRQIGGHKA